MNSMYSLNIIDGRIRLNHEKFGHPFGWGLISPNRNYRYVAIAKNASSSISNLLFNNKWDSIEGGFNDDVTNIVVVRNPLERWISGMTEYLVGKNSSLGEITRNLPNIFTHINFLNDEFIIKIITDQIYFDGHTLPQTWYLEGINVKRTKFFYMDDEFKEKICDFLKVNKSLKNINESKRDKLKNNVKEILQDIVSKNINLTEEIDKHYYCDHKLIDSVKFE